MKKMIVFCLVICASVTAVVAQKRSEKVLRHIVLFKFKDSASNENIKKVEAAFRQLPSKIKLIKAFEWGINNSPEKLNEGLTHCFSVAFASEKDRNDYLVNPAHKAFVKTLQPILESSCCRLLGKVIDLFVCHF